MEASQSFHASGISPKMCSAALHVSPRNSRLNLLNSYSEPLALIRHARFTMPSPWLKSEFSRRTYLSLCSSTFKP